MTIQQATYTTLPCMFCDKATTLELDPAKVRRWVDGELVQSVFEDWTPEQRELLITGTHAECWPFTGED